MNNNGQNTGLANTSYLMYENIATKEFAQILTSALRSVLFAKPADVLLFQNLNRQSWIKLIYYSAQQGVSALLYDALRFLPKNLLPPSDIIVDWTLAVEKIENRYDKEFLTAKKLSEIYRKNDIKILIFKGLCVAKYYPEPSHREFGDIDIYLYGNFERGNSVAKNSGAQMQLHSTPKHTEFKLDGTLIENHKNFLNIEESKTETVLEKYLLQTLSESTLFSEGYYVPSINFNALYLLMHAAQHFGGRSGLAARHVCDWALFLLREQKNINWDWVKKIIVEVRLDIFFNEFTALAANVAGCDFTNLYISQSDKNIMQRMFNDIFLGNPKEQVPKQFFAKLVFKIKKLIARKWKYDKILPKSFWAVFFRFRNF